MEKLPVSVRKQVSKNLVEENLFANPVIRKFLKKNVDEDHRVHFQQRLSSSRNWLLKNKKSLKACGDIEAFHERFIHVVSNQLTTLMTIPDEKIMTQGDEDTPCTMSFIIQGDCDVKMVCQDSSINAGDNLVKGEHFGEVRMLYGCPRTSTIVSKSYNIMGQLEQSRYRLIINEYPSFDKAMRTHLWAYQDPIKNFFYTCLSKFSYFRQYENPAKKGLNQE